MRYLMITTYNGTKFSGFQKQKQGNAIQNHLEDALKTILKQDIQTTGSGRTDAGVSAYSQPVHFETETEIEPNKFIRSMNGLLPDDIKVLSIEKSNIHARFDAKKKTYQYKMYRNNIELPLKQNSLRINENINIKEMKKFAKYLIGEHDFKGFQASGSPTETTIRTIYNAKLNICENDITFEITGNGFLYKMVRNIVGTMLLIGEGKLNLKELKPTLFNSFKAKTTAKPEYLYLKNVEY